MISLRWTILALSFFLMLPALHAEPLKIDGDSPRKRITVTMEDAKIDAILKGFSEAYGFEVKGTENTQQGDPISVSMTGSLKDILKRLLRNRNHLIVSSPDSTSGVEKVVIVDSTYGVLPLKTRKIRRKNRRKKTRRRASTTSQATQLSRNKVRRKIPPPRSAVHQIF